MKTVTKKKLYEAMFLVDSGDAGSDWDGIIAAIKKILKKAKVKSYYIPWTPPYLRHVVPEERADQASH